MMTAPPAARVCDCQRRPPAGDNPPASPDHDHRGDDDRPSDGDYSSSDGDHRGCGIAALLISGLRTAQSNRGER